MAVLGEQRLRSRASEAIREISRQSRNHSSGARYRKRKVPSLRRVAYRVALEDLVTMNGLVRNAALLLTTAAAADNLGDGTHDLPHCGYHEVDQRCVMHCVISAKSGICPAPSTLRNKHGREPGDGSYGYGCWRPHTLVRLHGPRGHNSRRGPLRRPADPLDPTDDLPGVGDDDFDAGLQPNAEEKPRQRRSRASSWRFVLMQQGDSE